MENKEAFDFIDQYKNNLLENIENVIGIHLFGSLAYGGFNEKSSDIDLVVITESFLAKTEIECVKNIHKNLDKISTKWSNRLEVSYTPIEMLKNKNIPILPRPYFNKIFYNEANYGNEWLINNYLLLNYGKTLYGQDFKTFVDYNITIDDIKEACFNDFLEEWLPKIDDDEWFSNSHYQAYTVLNICRIIYTIFNSEIENKQKSTKWVSQKYPEWKVLIEEAEQWDYSKSMNKQNEIKKYIEYMENVIFEYKSKSYCT
jgi:predicted nucleotidyltransferase